MPAPVHAHSSPVEGQQKSVAKKPVQAAQKQPASVDGGYRLAHQAHPLDSYQNAVTPPPATER
ncbi:hypothetical protein [Dyella japonica]|nr:hypothetical protein [Dyella japonica]